MVIIMTCYILCSWHRVCLIVFIFSEIHEMLCVDIRTGEPIKDIWSIIKEKKKQQSQVLQPFNHVELDDKRWRWRDKVIQYVNCNFKSCVLQKHWRGSLMIHYIYCSVWMSSSLYYYYASSYQFYKISLFGCKFRHKSIACTIKCSQSELKNKFKNFLLYICL